MSVRLPRRLLSETVPVMRHTPDPYGGSWQQSGTPRARVNHSQRMVRSDDGDEVLSSATVYYAPGVDVAHGDRLVIDGQRADDDPPGRAIVSIARRRGPGGRVALIEVSLQ